VIEMIVPTHKNKNSKKKKNLLRRVLETIGRVLENVIFVKKE